MFRRLVILLLFFVSVAYAIPPATPTLDIQVDGLKVSAKWSAVGATGYRLFYAPQSDVTDLKNVDMGTETQISTVFEPGTAMYMAIQAYNDEGDSTASEFQFFMVQDPDQNLNTDEATSPDQAEVQPAMADRLEFKKVSLDTPVAFVPTVEDSQIQERVVQSQNENAIYDAAFDEGKISMTLEIAPTGVKRNALELLFCLGDEKGCDPLIVWNNQEPKGFVRTVTISDLPDDTEKSVYVDLLIPASLAEKLRNQPVGEAYEYTIYAHDVNSTGSNAKLVPVTKIPVISLGERENEQANTETTPSKTEDVTEESHGESRATLREAIYNQANGHYYRPVNYEVTYYEAARAAKMSSYNNLRGSLMVINDPAERTFIQSNNKLGLDEWGIYWIGDGKTTDTGKGMTLGGPRYKYSETSKGASERLGSYIIEYIPSANAHDPIYNSANKHYYQIMSDQSNFSEAFQAAAVSSYQNLPGSLLVINDAAERTFVQNNLKLEQWGIYWISNSSGASISLGGSGYNYKEQTDDRSKVLGNYIIEYGAAPPSSSGSSSSGGTSGSSTGSTGSTTGSSTGSTSTTGKTEEKPPKLITCKITGRELSKEEKEEVAKKGGDITSTFTGVRCYKEFGKGFSNSAAGIKFAMKPNVWIYRLVPPPNLGKKTNTDSTTATKKKKTEFGARIGAIGEVTATIVGFTFDVAAMDVGLLKNRGKNTTRSIEMFVLGAKVAADGQGMVKVSKTDKGEWRDCHFPGSNCSTPPTSENDNGLLGESEDFDEIPASQQAREAKNLADLVKEVGKEYTKTFVIGFIPVEAKAGIKGTANVGLGFKIGQVDVTTDTDTMGLDVTLLGGPGANLSVSASAGVTILIASVGVEVKLVLIEDELVFEVTTKLRKNFRIGGKIENLLQGPYGSLLLYVTWYQPAFSIPPWEKKRKEKTLASWDSGLKYTYTLFSWGENGDEVKGAESKDIKGAGAPSRFDYVPVVVDKEPAEGTDINGQPYSPRSWVCFYRDENFQGTPACVEMPEEFEEVGFDVMVFDNKKGTWNDNISSIKIWGPLRVAVFQHTLSEGDEKRGNSAYWYAHAGQMEYVQYVGNSMNDQITSVLMTKITEQSNHPFKRRAKTVQVPNYNYEWRIFNSNSELNQYLQSNPDTTSTFSRKEGRSISALLQKKNGVKNEEQWDDYPEVCFYRDESSKGNYYCYPSGGNKGGDFDGVWKLGAPRLGDVYGTTKDNKNDWRNEVSSLALKGEGPYMLCLYNDTQNRNNGASSENFIWKENGDNSCFMRARMRYSSETINLIGMNDRMNDFYLMQDVGFALISDFSSSLEEAGTSSLPGSKKMIARGRLDGIYRRTGRGDINALHHPDSASIIFVTGPITVRLYKDNNQKGTHSTFYLDEGEWDVSYLNGINDAVSGWIVWDGKLDGTYRDK